LNVLVVGAKGNMGKRYCAILRQLGHLPICVDLPWPAVVPDDWRYAIVATPTDSHLEAAYQLADITEYNPIKRHVLMEKPVAKSLSDSHRVYTVLGESNMQLNCVNQYNYLPEVELGEKGNAKSWYRYFNHGKDGIHWDCFQIYALASASVELSHKSAWWDCGINGRRVSLSGMCWAYIDMIEDWLGAQNRVWGWDVIERTTLRVLENA
jgi:hypothetical protein